MSARNGSGPLLFADTFFFLALLNRRDEAHHRAAAVAASLGAAIVTTQWVLTELGDAAAEPGKRSVFISFLRKLGANRRVEIIPASPELFDRGLVLYAQRPDKPWSLTDCISFVVMQDRAITDALTGDHHFEQAGFKMLLK